jgi:hypothetical protein
MINRSTFAVGNMIHYLNINKYRLGDIGYAKKENTYRSWFYAD